MRTAIFNSFPFHYEMFAHVLDYFKENSLTVDVYTNTTDNGGWLSHYEIAYGVTKWHPIQSFNPGDYDTVFVLTDDDPAYDPAWSTVTRVIIIEHGAKRSLGHPAHRKLQTRLRDEATWIIPVWNNAPFTKYDSLTVMAVGNAAIFVEKYLPTLFSNFSEIQFILVDRNITAGKTNNVTRYKNMDAATMVEAAARSHYILFWPTTGYSFQHKHDTLTASVPLAYSVGTPLILPADFRDALGLRGIVGLEDGKPLYLTKPSSDSWLEERRRLLAQRNRILTSALSKIPQRIFQTFETKEFAPRFQEIIDSWKRHNPTYIYDIYDANQRLTFLRAYFDERVNNAYLRIIPGAYKADLWRYCVLYHYGGIYADIDTLCLGSIDDFLKPETEYMMPIDLNPGHEGYHNLANGFIACVPRSPIILDCIERIVRHVETNTIPASKLDFSGPGVFGRAVNTYLQRDEQASFVGQEGHLKNIHFLRFEPWSEYVKDVAGAVLFQNKNGNAEIDALYRVEIAKARTVDWVTATQILA